MGYDNIRNLLRVSASTDNTRVVQKQLPKREPFGYNQFFNKYEKVPSQLRRMFEFVQAPVNIEAKQRRLWG